MTSLEAISVYRHSSEGSIGSSLTAPKSGGRPALSSRGTAVFSAVKRSLVLAGGYVISLRLEDFLLFLYTGNSMEMTYTTPTDGAIECTCSPVILTWNACRWIETR